jgi:hypothetical protein
MFSSDYRVCFAPYSERHFIKRFEKKYRKNWELTRQALIEQFKRIEALLLNGRTNTPIHESADRQHWIVKHPFAVVGLHQSPQGSGNRAIVHVDREAKTVHVLLVYHKTDLGSAPGGETAAWEKHIRENCREHIGWLLGS